MMQGRALSAEEFADAVYKEPWRYQRERGRLVVMAPDGGDHQDNGIALAPKAVLVLGASARGRCIPSRPILGFAWTTGRTASATSASTSRAFRQRNKIPDRIPDLMFEIVSPGRTSRNRDYIKKRSEYERLGVKEYVIVDRFKKQVKVHTLIHGVYQEQVLTSADTYTSPLLPGLAIPLAKVWK